MAQIAIHPSPELPLSLKWQILAFIRVEWWWVFQGENRFWDYTQKPTHPINFVLHEHEIVISHAEINWRMIDHAGHSYKVYGLSAVFTFPSFRKEGYGQDVVQAATDYIHRSDADIAMVFCLPHLQGFYESSGWVYIQDAQVMYGDPQHPSQDDEEIMLMLFVSKLGKETRDTFNSAPIYVGSHTW